MTLCTDRLTQVLQTTDGLKEDVISGKITVGEVATKAWGNEMKASCYQEMPVYEIYNFISSFTGEQMQLPTTGIVSQTSANNDVFKLPAFNFNGGEIMGYLINA